MSEFEAYTPQDIQAEGLDPSRLPRHVAFIMDGNGRWALARGLDRIDGHRQGALTARMVIEESARLGLDQITLFCLSSENWKRPPDELNLLLKLLVEYLISERPTLTERDLQFAMIGNRDGLPPDVLRELDTTAAAAGDNKGMRVCLAINYGSRAEIARAAARLAKQTLAGTIAPNTIDETAVAANLDTANMPDPDLVIRSAGEKRLSNFLLWQLSYAELFVTSQCWPEFDRNHYLEALRDFARRDRRFGGLNI